MVIRTLDDRTYYVLSAFTHLGAVAKAVRLFGASLRSQKMSYQMRSVDNFVISNSVVALSKQHISIPRFGDYEDVERPDIGLPDSPIMRSFLLSIDTSGLSHTVFELLSWLQKRFPRRPLSRPSDPLVFMQRLA